MEFRNFRYFIAVYEELSLSAASRRCFVAQPSISSAIAQLETDLDCTLFIRHSRGVTPTPEGTLLYPQACQLLAEVDTIKRQFQHKPTHLPLRLALMPFLSGKRVSQIIKALIQQVPGLDLTLVDVADESDARIISSAVLADNEAFHKLWVDHYVLAVPLNHPLARHQSIKLEQLDTLAFISRKPCDIDDAWQFALQKKGVFLDIKATVKTDEYALDLVMAGLGVSVVPAQSIENRPGITKLEVKNLPLERVVGLAYQQDKPLSTEILAAIDSTKQAIKSNE